jgi:hypothetical protein
MKSLDERRAHDCLRDDEGSSSTLLLIIGFLVLLRKRNLQEKRVFEYRQVMSTGARSQLVREVSDRLHKRAGKYL